MKHIHKYIRKNLTRDPNKPAYNVYACTLPSCMHHLRVEVCEGKVSICNVCNEPFVMTKATLTLQKPHCIDCTKEPRNKGLRNKLPKTVIKSIDDFLREKME